MDLRYTYGGLICGNIFFIIVNQSFVIERHIIASGLTLLIMILLKQCGLFGGKEGYSKSLDTHEKELEK